MKQPTTYEIVIRGHATEQILGHLSDDFVIAHPEPGTTHLTGVIRDAAHLHGVLAHLTAVAIEIISVNPDPVLVSRPVQTFPTNSVHPTNN